MPLNGCAVLYVDGREGGGGCGGRRRRRDGHQEREQYCWTRNVSSKKKKFECK